MTNETERKKELVGEARLSYGASGASATSIATRASGAELIRQLSYHKLNHYYQSDETLHQFSSTTTTVSKRKSGNPSATSIVKRFSDNQYDYQYQKHRQASAAGATRPRLLRQSTTNSESVAGTSSAAGGANSGHYNRRRLLADTRDQRSWRSCDASHQDVPPVLAGTHLLGGSGGVRTRHDSVAKSDDMTPSVTPSFLDLSSSSSSMHRQSVTPRPSPVGSHQGRLDKHQEKVDECDADEQQRKVDELVDEQVRYTKRPTEGANGPDEDCVVLPPLAATGTRLVVSRKNANADVVVLSPEPMLANAGPQQPALKNKVVDVQQNAVATKKKKKVRRSGATAGGSKTAPVKVAASAIAAVAVVTVGVANKTSFSSSDESNNPRRRARGIVILTSVFLLFTCLFMVGITLRLAPLIDDLSPSIEVTPSYDASNQICTRHCNRLRNFLH